MAVPAVMVAIAVWRVVVKDRSRAATGRPVWGSLGERGGDRGGGTSQDMDEFTGDYPGGVLLSDQGGGMGTQPRPGAGSGAVQGGFRFAQSGFGAVPAPPVGRYE